MKLNVKEGLFTIIISILSIFNCIYLGFCINLKGEEAEITKIEQFSHTAECYVPKYLGWVRIPDNNYKEGDQITIPINVSFLNKKNIEVHIGVVYYLLITFFFIWCIAGFGIMFDK